MNKSIIPFDETLDCTRCGSSSECKRECDTFYNLMFSVIDFKSQHHKFESLLNMTLSDYNSSDVELKAISAFLKELSDQGCRFVSIYSYEVYHNPVHGVI